MVHMRTNSEINAEIYSHGAAFFEAVRKEVTTRSTQSTSSEAWKANRGLLEAKISAVLDKAVFRPNLNHNELWQCLWPYVVYAGTKAEKASAEVESMRKLVPLFQSLDHFDPTRFVFDKREWAQFVQHWRNRYPSAKWLEKAKADVDWKPGDHFKKTTPEVWKILIKDNATYNGLRFSALPAKVEKYVKLAGLLHERRATGSKPALNNYTGGLVFSSEHLTGQHWVEERQLLIKARELLAKEVGRLTAMHAMLDLGLKTIKPDRVMTYLFSQLGWLQTLPDTLTKDQVLRAYLQPEVIEEMTQRSDVLAHRLDKAGLQQAHRLLDIWLVKFGQEPDAEWGITQNLQDSPRKIREILDEVKSTQFPELTIDIQAVTRMWPSAEFSPVGIPKASQKQNGEGDRDGDAMDGDRCRPLRRRRVAGGTSKRLSSIKLSSEETSNKFMAQWRTGLNKHPDVYPSRMDNEPKEAILRLIASGVDPEAAFLSILQSQGKRVANPS